MGRILGILLFLVLLVLLGPRLLVFLFSWLLC